MGERQQVPVVGGPLDGQTYPLSTAMFLSVPDAKDRVDVVQDGEVRTLFGYHTYALHCYRNGGGYRYQWRHFRYEKPPQLR